MQFTWNIAQGVSSYNKQTGFGFVIGAVYNANAALRIPETNSSFLPQWWYAGTAICDVTCTEYGVQLHMLDTIWCLILPLCFAPYNLLIMKNNFQGSIPESLIESARLDGASHFTILAKIVVPLSKPIMATIALFYAVGRWNAYSDALYYIKQNVSLRPLQLKLYYLIVAASESFQSEGVSTVAMTNPEVLKAACIIFAAVPIICVYPFIQKYFVQGTMVGAVKG